MRVNVKTVLGTLIHAQQVDRAARRVLESHRSELHGYSVSVFRDAGDAGDAFSQVGKNLWSGLPALALG